MSSDSLPAEVESSSKGRAWAQLVRLPNVFTVIADVSAAYLLIAHGPRPWTAMLCVVGAGIALYWAGMILNDVFDVDRDRVERPDRPLAAGQIPIGQAKFAGWGLLGLGILLAAGSGFLPGASSPTTWVPAAVGVALAAMIVLYDGPLKKTPLAPPAMGSCRVLSFLLGAAPHLPVIVNGQPEFPTYLIAIAFGFGIYVMGITTMARHEATGGASPNLATGLFVMIVGTVMLGFAPKTAERNLGWFLSPHGAFPMLVGLIALPVVMRALGALRDPTPLKIQTTIRAGVLNIIPLSAAFAFLGAGPVWGLCVFALVVPSLLLAVRFRVT